MNIAPEKFGMSSRLLEKILRELDENEVPIHSLLVARGDDIIFDAYWSPFTRESLHRMNSVTKSFVALAIGALVDEGRISLSQRVVEFFPEAKNFDLNAEQCELTVENLLTMRTGYRPLGNAHWVRDREYGRIKSFFERKPETERGASFYYDSTGSYILGVIVERLTKKSFIEYLKEKFLLDIGFSRDADCILGGEGYSWSDSGLLCTTEDLYKTAKLINRDGLGYISKDFIKNAKSAQVDTPKAVEYKSYGYGYQIWKAKYDGFMFLGMGAQILICIPKRDLYIACTADTQMSEKYREIIVEKLYEIIDYDVNSGHDVLPEDNAAFESLIKYREGLKLTAYKPTDIPKEYKNRETPVFKADENPMGIKSFSLEFADGSGIFKYENAQGYKEIGFGFGYNVFSEFPEDGYFDMEIGKSTPKHRYPIAASAKWQDSRTLLINVQFIGRHLGGDIITLTLDTDTAVLNMHKSTNCFLDSYDGECIGRK